jgi:hypothetical protein
MSELDEECEHIITSFMQELYGRLIFPIPTEDLTKLIERDADDLDQYSDLSDEGSDVEGITYFRPGQKPIVRIASGLFEHSRSENRLRTTLSHEYGHVKYHDPLWQRVKKPTLNLSVTFPIVCPRLAAKFVRKIQIQLEIGVGPT